MRRLPMMRDGDATALRELADHDSDWVYYLNWTAALHQRDFAGACAILRRWPRDTFDWPWCHVQKSLSFGITCLLWGKQAEARQHLLEARTKIEISIQQVSDDPRHYIALGEAQAALGDGAAALANARHALAMRPRSQDANFGLLYQLEAVLRVFISAGAIDEALSLLDDYLGAAGAGWTIEGLLPNPRLDPLRQHPGFIALVEKHRRLA